MDKLIFDGRKVTISNDGATIMKLLEIAHPAAKTLVDISMSQVINYILLFLPLKETNEVSYFVNTEISLLLSIVAQRMLKLEMVPHL